MTTTAERDDAIRRIRKLMRVAKDDGATEGEIENAMRFARSLMDKFAIAESDATGEDDAFEVGDYLSMSGRVADYDQMIGAACAFICDVGSCVEVHRSRQTLRFFGPANDVAVAKALFRELRAAMRAMARMRFGPGWRRMHKDYCRGFSSRVSRRAKTLATSMRDTPETTAIVLSKRSAIERYGREQFRLSGGGIGGAAKVPRDLNYDAFAVGDRDGRDVSLARNGIAHEQSSTPAALYA